MNKIRNVNIYKKNILKILDIYLKKIIFKYIYKIISSIINYKLKINNYESRINNYESKINNYESRIDNYESRIDNYESRIDNCESRINNYESRINNYESKINNYESKINNYEFRIDNLILETGKNESEISEEEIENCNKEIDSYKQIINNYKLKIDNYELNIIQNESNINENEVKINDYVKKIEILEYSINKIYSKKEYKLNNCENKIKKSLNFTNLIESNLEEYKNQNKTYSLKIDEMHKNQIIMNQTQSDIIKKIEKIENMKNIHNNLVNDFNLLMDDYAILKNSYHDKEKINISLNDENKHLKIKLEGINCCICYSRKPNIVFTSCKHLVICSQCEIANRRITRFRKCPICRKDYTGILKIHN